MFASFVQPRTSLSPRSVKDQASARAFARAALEQALRRRENQRARVLLADLQALEPDEARWPHKLGDLLRAAGQEHDAAAAYRAAARIYGERGFVDRSRAMISLARTLAGRGAPLTVSSHASLRPDSGSLELPVMPLRFTT